MEGWLLQLPQVWQPCQKVSFQWVLAGGDNPDELGPSVLFPWLASTKQLTVAAL